eukprot:GILJ01033165.1.p1 GENE.GILJ01033165.1~~GILJ01033165.1.p1  ORF type:complete len:110 (-),score=18.58 GILJ01033165.1:231-560(-)
MQSDTVVLLQQFGLGSHPSLDTIRAYLKDRLPIDSLDKLVVGLSENQEWGNDNDCDSGDIDDCDCHNDDDDTINDDGSSITDQFFQDRLCDGSCCDPRPHYSEDIGVTK